MRHARRPVPRGGDPTRNVHAPREAGRGPPAPARRRGCEPGAARARLARGPPVPGEDRERARTSQHRDLPAPCDGSRRGPEHAPLPKHRAGDPRPDPGADPGARPGASASSLGPVRRGARQPAGDGLDRPPAPRPGGPCRRRERDPVGAAPLEQLVRWSTEKAAALPSWDGWPQLGAEPAISRLLLVRRTRATKAVVADHARQLRLAYPAHPDDAIAALTGIAQWPGPALVWVVLDGARTRLASGR